VFNNLFFNSNWAKSVFVPYEAASVPPAATYFNYNNWFDTGTQVPWKLKGDKVTFADWRTALQVYLPGAEVNSVTTNPGFVNTSGTYANVSDFKRSAYTANGRGGAWSSVMGAYITGNEQIGATF
jgi:hypothetical protein